MTRRLLRYAADGLCLLSLLAAAATAWVWWRARPFERDGADVAAGPVLVRATSYSEGVRLEVVRDWNSRPGIWAGSAWGPDQRTFFVLTNYSEREDWQWGWWQGHAAPARACPGPDGRFERLTSSEATVRLGRGAVENLSPPLRLWVIYFVPHWQILLATAAAPAAWAAGRGRRAWRRRRRARAGRCAACGYDLRATPDPAGPRLPRCPECGAAAAAAKEIAG